MQDNGSAIFYIFLFYKSLGVIWLSESLPGSRRFLLFFDLIQNRFGSNVLLQLLNFGIYVCVNIQVICNSRDNTYEFGDLMLGEKIDLDIEIRTSISRCRHPVLADQHEGREEYRLYRSHHRQNHERRIKLGNKAYETEIQNDPGTKQNQVQVNKCHASGEAGNGCREPVLEGGRRLFVIAAAFQHLNVAEENRPHTWWLGRRLGNPGKARVSVYRLACGQIRGSLLGAKGRV